MNRLFYRLLSGRLGAGFEIRILTRQTAAAFDQNPPKSAGHSARDLLKTYARFTADAAVKALTDGQDLRTLQRELYLMSRRLGNRLIRFMRPKDEKDCLAILTLLYKNIGISIREESPGEFCVDHCYFSGFYTPAICAVISAVDAGIFAGIFSGGTLKFCARITEGRKQCRAEFKKHIDQVGK